MSKIRLSLIIVTKNCAKTLELTLKSVKNLVNEIILVDDCSQDATLEIAKKYQAKIYNCSGSFSKRKKYALEKAHGEWILSLDSDEKLSEDLIKEIKITIDRPLFSGYLIPYQNHFLDQKINYGGEAYLQLRLFKKNAVIINADLLHEHFVLKKRFSLDKLNNKILHYSYRSLWQVFKKFTIYAKLDAKKRKNSGEKTSFKKIFLYPPHMFWARFIKDKGYQDGLFRLPLDLGFAYLEFLTYFLMIFYK